LAAKKPGQVERVTWIGFDAGCRDEADQERMADGHRGDQRSQMVVQVPGVGGRLQHDGVSRSEVFATPRLKVGHRNALWTEDYGLLGIDCGHCDGVAVDIQGYEAVRRLDGRVHEHLLLRLGPVGASFGGSW
jgi:hypothetical protein